MLLTLLLNRTGLSFKNKEKPVIISLTGPSGIGKGFIKEKLLQMYPFIEELAWFTTRQLRPNEHSNRAYVSLFEFNELVESDKIVLVQDLYGHRYGLKKEDLLPSSHLRLTELHPDNLEAALEINPEILVIGLTTPDLSLLRERISIIRKTETPAQIDERLAVAKVEIETIMRQKSHFAAVIGITKASEVSVFNQVLAVLAPHLSKKGG